MSDAHNGIIILKTTVIVTHLPSPNRSLFNKYGCHQCSLTSECNENATIVYPDRTENIMKFDNDFDLIEKAVINGLRDQDSANAFYRIKNKFKELDSNILPTHEMIDLPTKGPVPLEKSYCQNDCQIQKIRTCTEQSCGRFPYCDHKRPCTLDSHKYTVYEGIVEGNKFFSRTSNTTTDRRRLNNGCIVYRILGEADTSDDARTIIKKCQHFFLSDENKHDIRVGKFFIDIEETSLGKLAITIKKEKGDMNGLMQAITVLIPESLDQNDVEY